MEILKDIFGYENVFDFSGINEYTNDIHNYYERGHYRPILGALLLQKYMQTITDLKYILKVTAYYAKLFL